MKTHNELMKASVEEAEEELAEEADEELVAELEAEGEEEAGNGREGKDILGEIEHDETFCFLLYPHLFLFCSVRQAPRSRRK